jgi:oxalate decarboxylase/phosphoglucose isomerase-like protein (cupin superfamily)
MLEDQSPMADYNPNVVSASICGEKTTQVGPGAMMYCAGNTVHGITNTGKVPLTFYWSKWLGK